MAKVKTVYRCEQCGTDHSKWAGQCSDCGEWNSLTEVKIEPVVSHRAKPMGGGFGTSCQCHSTQSNHSIK